MFNLGVLSGPAIAGLVYVTLGPAWCFTLNGLSFGAVIAALSFMRLRPFVPKNIQTAAFEDFKHGLSYVRSHRIIRSLLGIVFVMCLFGTGYMTLIPAWSVNVLGGDAVTNGWLLSARGVGALSAAMMIAALGRFDFKGKLITLGTFVFPTMLFVFANVRTLALSLVFMGGIGWGYIIISNVLNSLVQTLVADEFRGRVVSLYAFGVFGLTPAGALLAGWGAEFWGEPLIIILGAVICLAYATWVFLRVPEIRQHKS
jgi:predicted MFS family arabinose efflux permease